MAATAVCGRSEKIGDEFCHMHNGSENRFKRGRQKTVTWPIDHKICEVRHFLVDDAPSSLGPAMHEHLQCKQANAHEAYHLSKFHVPAAIKRARLDLEAEVPLRFGSTSSVTKSSHRNSQSDAIMAVMCRWHGPPKVLLDASWLWAGGEESLEVASQQQRERRVFEAFYPRLASIPDSPLEPLQESNKEIDDALVSEVPLVPLEEQELENEDMELESISTAGESAVCRVSEQVAMPSNGSLHCISVEHEHESTNSLADSKMAAAAAAACMVVKALGESDLVDEKLLLELLKNPSLLKSLTCSSSNNLKGTKSQDQDNSTGSSSRQEPASSSKLNRSPVSVLAEWGEGARTNSFHRFAPNVNVSTDVQLSTNLSCMSSKPLPPTSLPTPYPCNNLESSRGSVQQGAECTPRIHPQIPEISHANPSDSSSKHVYVPTDGLNGSSKDPYTCTQAAMATNTPFSVHPTRLPSKDFLHGNLMQVGALKYRSNEDSAIQRKTGFYSSSSRSGGRNPRPCMYYNSPRGCRNGASCAFAHQSLGSGVNTIAQ